MVELDNTIRKEKENLRSQILEKLRSKDPQERLTESREIKRRLFQEESFQRAKCIMFYASKEYEVDTTDMIEGALSLGKRVVLPVTETQKKRLIPSEIKDPKADLTKGAFGIYEPKREKMKAVDLKDIDMIVVPGVVFDKKGNRIGHGKGYFDRFLKSLPKKIPTIALAFRCQLLERIKTLSWDVSVTKVITA